MPEGGSWWPSLAWPSLPQGFQLPTFGSFTTRHWQRKLLRYLIKRTLGGLLRIPEDDIESSTFLDADIGSGHLRLRNVELDEVTINRLISAQLAAEDCKCPLEVHLESSRLGEVEVLVGSAKPDPGDGGDSTARPQQQSTGVTATERLFSAPIQFIARDLALDFRIIPTTISEDTAKKASATGPNTHDSHRGVDPTASIYHVAEDYVHEIAEAASREALDDDDEQLDVPGAFYGPDKDTQGDTTDEVEEIGLIARVIETLVARLHIKVNNVDIRVQFSSDFTLLVQLGSFESRTAVTETNLTKTQTRTIICDEFCISVEDCQEPRQTPIDTVRANDPRLGRGRDSTSSSSRSSSIDSANDLAMSMAIADLRSSQYQAERSHSRTDGLEEALARSEQLGKSIYLDAEGEDDDKLAPSEVLARDSATKAPRPARRCIIGLYAVDDGTIKQSQISLQMTKISRMETLRDRRTSYRTELLVPILAVTLDPALILAADGFMSKIVGLVTQKPSASAPPPTESSGNSPDHLFHCRTQRIDAYIQLADQPRDIQFLLQWCATVEMEETCAPLVHAYIEGIEYVHRTATEEGKIAVHDYGLDLINSTLTSGASRYPIIMTNPGLLWQYNAETLQPSEHAPSPGRWSTKPWESLDALRAALPVDANSTSANTSLSLLRDAIAVKVSKTETCIKLQPIHVRLDVAALDWLLSLTMNLGNLGILTSQNQVTVDSAAAGPASISSTRAFLIQSSCIRVDLKCPHLPHNSAEDDMRCMSLRSGIFGVSLHDVRLRLSAKTPSQSTNQVVLDASAALVLSAESHGGTTAKQASPSKPASLQLTRRPHHSHLPSTSLNLQLPSCSVYLAKQNIDALQYFADDASRVINRMSLLLGRFRQKGPDSQTLELSVSEPNVLSPPQATTTLKLEVDIGAATARLQFDAQGTSPQEIVSLLDQTKLRILLRNSGEDDLSLLATVKDLTVTHVSQKQDEISQECLLRRRKASPLPLVQISISSRTDDHLRKHSTIDLEIDSIDLVVRADTTTLAAKLATLVKTPPGSFLDVIPSETTTLRVTTANVAISLIPISLSSAVIVLLQTSSLQTRFERTSTSTKVSMEASEVQLILRNGPDENASFAHLAHLSDTLVQLHLDSKTLGTVVLCTKGPKVVITLCPDTMLSLAAFVPDFLPEAEDPKVELENPSITDLSGSIVYSRVGQNSSAHIPPRRNEERTAEIISSVDQDLVQIYGAEKLDVESGWFDGRKRAQTRFGQDVPNLEIDIRQGNIVLSLFEGYDFNTTRTYIRQAVKATRRRLEKIKQLLAEGQVPEQTLDEVADPLLQSVFLPPRRSKIATDETAPDDGEDDVLDRVVAFDDELDQEGDENGDPLLTWETVRERPAMKTRRPSSTSREKTAKRTGILHRPRHSAIDIRLSGVRLYAKQFADSSPIASSLTIKVGQLSIVDNIRTSTWNKFLTELRPGDGGVMRPNESPMATIRLKMLRSEDESVGKGADLFVRVSPLRLHVDQDALDFFKAFFSFRIETPGLQSEEASSSGPHENAEEYTSQSTNGFVQRVEISAIKIKLDYKPKRVDYYALRQGRAIEMMNFFHFEASEMILRHLILTGIPSWAKVGDMLQDIWTPDVKTNQLADFLAGINPVRSVVNVGQGVADLVLLPVAQYKKDGRLARGLQRGGTKFAKSTAMEAIKLGARLATGTQVILEHTERVLGGRIAPSQGVSVSGTSAISDAQFSSLGRSEWLLTASDEGQDRGEVEDSAVVEPLSRFSDQPEDVMVGLQTAYKSLTGNVRSAAETILAVPMEVYERSNEGPVRAVVRAVPIAVLRSGIGATEAMSKTLLGLRNTLDPGAKDEAQDKYKRRSYTS